MRGWDGLGTQRFVVSLNMTLKCFPMRRYHSTVRAKRAGRVSIRVQSIDCEGLERKTGTLAI